MSEVFPADVLERGSRSRPGRPAILGSPRYRTSGRCTGHSMIRHLGRPTPRFGTTRPASCRGQCQVAHFTPSLLFV
jgi:hypothetical protein